MSFLVLAGCARVPVAEPTFPIDGNATELVSERQIGEVPPAQRSGWERYVANSNRLRTMDRASMEAELRAEGKASMTPAPYRKVFRVEPEMTQEWFHGVEAGRMADNILSYQTPSGGWSKHVDFTQRPRKRGESYYSENGSWHYTATIDNDSTTEQLRFVAAAYTARSEPRYRDSFLKGVDYLLEAQFPNGCWPQVYPLQGGYHDAATYNDEAIVNVMRLLGDVGEGKFPFVPPDQQHRANAGVARGVECILASQVIVNGVRTVWAQQHHPITLAPVSARSYELVALCGRESAGVTAYLMSFPSPDARVVEAVHAAVAWFRKHQIYGYEYNAQTLSNVAGAGPLWARLYEIETARPIFSNRDGIKRYDWNELTDRRRGYTWYVNKEPLAVLAQYEAWASQHPRATMVVPQ